MKNKIFKKNNNYYFNQSSVKETLITLQHIKCILELTNKKDTYYYLKVNEYINYLHEKYIIPRIIHNVYLSRVIQGDMSQKEFEKWIVKIMGRPDLKNGGCLLL